MPAQLVALTEGPDILLDKPILLLGRHPECDIQIDSRKVSRRHCVIAQVADYLVIRDLDSCNGVRINGTRVVEGKLYPGDELTLGNHRYRVVWGDLPAGPPAARLRQEAARPATAPEFLDDDEVLESCDEPVPLREGPRGAIVSKPMQPPAEPPSPPPPPSLILPDDFRLAPNSDPGPAPQGPGSHH